MFIYQHIFLHSYAQHWGHNAPSKLSVTYRLQLEGGLEVGLEAGQQLQRRLIERRHGERIHGLRLPGHSLVDRAVQTSRELDIR